MEAGLVVLCGNADKASQLLDGYAGKLAATGVAMHIHVLRGDVASAVTQYLHGHPQVLFVVPGDPDDPVHQSMLAGKRCAAPPVPIVVVSQDTPGSVSHPKGARHSADGA